MKVVHINTFDCAGGAARAANRLHQGLRRIGIDSRMFVREQASADPSVVLYEPPRNLPYRAYRVARREFINRAIGRYRHTAPDGISNFSDDRGIDGGRPWKHLPQNDLLQLHWVSEFLDYRSFFSAVPSGKPIVWTLHDMFPFTGGCHYNQGCEKFAAACGACPQLGSHSARDLTTQVLRRKGASLKKIRDEQLHIVVPSRWLASEASRSALFSRFASSVIPYGLDTELFAPRSRSAAREVFGIPPGSKVLLFIADGMHLPRKGFHLLVQALASMQTDPAVLLVSVGSGQPADLQGCRHVHIDSVNDDRVLSHVYSAADIFVCPSLEDNLPNTMLEALACGIPVAGFDAGGIPDAVRPGITGMMAPAGDVQQLRRIIIELLANDAKRAEISANCRKITLQEYGLDLQARRYRELYEEMLRINGHSAGRSAAPVSEGSESWLCPGSNLGSQEPSPQSQPVPNRPGRL